MVKAALSVLPVPPVKMQVRVFPLSGSVVVKVPTVVPAGGSPARRSWTTQCPQAPVLPRFAVVCHARPVIGAKRRGGQTRAVEKRRARIRLPRIARGDWFGNLLGRNDDGIALNFRVRPAPLAVLAGHGKFLQLVALHHQSTVGIFELQLERAGNWRR